MPNISNNNSNSGTDREKRVVRRAVKSPEHITEPKAVNIGSIENATVESQKLSKKRKANKKSSVKRYVGRFFLTLLVVLVLAIYVVFSLVSAVATGPSPTIRDQLVLMAMQASATKWVPGLFLPSETVEKIVADSKKVNTETDSLEDYINNTVANSGNDESDIWEEAVDGMVFETISGKTFKAYVLLIKDPSRVFVGTSSDYKSNKEGMTIFNIAKKYNAVAAINGGEFSDPGGVGTGNNPIGITYSQGNLMWNDGHNNRTFIGLDKNNRLVVSEGMNKAKAEELSVRDGVCFQTGNVLITSDDSSITKHYADNNTGTAQRTAIGQTSDGTLIFIVTDGRSVSSLGATHNDIIDIMVSYGAVTAGMLDGGSSSMMYYRNYFEIYDYDSEKLDKYQKQGLVNKYKAFTSPRKIPTYFIVGEAGNEN